MNRACADFRAVPERLLRAWQSGSQEEWDEATTEARAEVSQAAAQCLAAARGWTSEASRSTTDAVRQLGDAARRLVAGDAEQGEEEALQADPFAAASAEEQLPGGAAAASSRVFSAPCGGVTRCAALGEWEPRALRLAEKGALDIKKYLFADEGKEKGTVKVYIQAQELEAVDGFREVHVDFQERALSARAVSKDGRVWLLRAGPLWGLVRAGECRYSLSSTGHKVSITLKKADAASTWHRLTEAPGKDRAVAPDVRDFI